MKRKGEQIDGWVIIDKPADIGSTPIVSKVKRGLNANKAGHAGTLDPFATGILPLALGQATKTISYIQDSDKDYTFTLQFGKTTDTLDSEGIITETSDVIPSESDILKSLPNFIGEITQIPPAYSAIKINGKRAYDLARSGVDVDIPSRTVRVYDLQFLGFKSADTADFSVRCGKGTYVRSLGRDIAESLNSVGYLTTLRRTRVGVYDLSCSISLEKFEEMTHNIGNIGDKLLPMESSLVGIPALTVADKKAGKLRSGLVLRGLQTEYDDGTVLIVKTATHLIGFGQIVGDDVKPVKIFNNPVPLTESE